MNDIYFGTLGPERITKGKQEHVQATQTDRQTDALKYAGYANQAII